MSRKFYFSFLVATVVFMAGHLVIFAQTAPVGGTGYPVNGAEGPWGGCVAVYPLP